MSIFIRIANLLRRAQVNRDIDAELQSHIALRIEDNLAQGMCPAEARRDAVLRFGNPMATRERVLAADAVLTIEREARDIRYVLRQLRRAPGFAATAIITLTLAIGANLVVFSALNAVLLRPLDVRNPASLYQIRHQAWSSGRLLTTSYPAFEDIRKRNNTFSAMAGVYGYSHALLRWQNTSILVHGDEVTGNYFDLLGVEPALGRSFHSADEHGPDSAPYIVLSDALWRNAFHADPVVIGASVALNGHSFTVIGVASPRFHGTERFVWPDYWVPLVNQSQVEGWDSLHSRTAMTVTVIGRLKPGVTPRQATENLNAISAQLAREYPATDDGQPLRLIHPGLLGDDGDVIRGFLWSVTALALLVLAAACANLAALFAARTSDRSRELALRVALGSSRMRLLRQLFFEAMTISLFGGAAGLACANLLIGLMNRSAPFVGALTIHIDARIYLTSAALTLASALLMGLAPAFQVLRSSPIQGMKNGPQHTRRLRRFALRDLLLGVQIAICALLITASLVAVRGMHRVFNTPLGFQPQGAMLADFDLSQVEHSDDRALQKQDAMLDAARTTPGVTAAGAISRTPMTGGMHGVPVYRPGTTAFRLDNSVLAPYVFSISPGYLVAARTRLLSGRDFSSQDTAKTPFVAIVNETFAHQMWADSPPIGHHFILSNHLTEVVGIAENGKYHDLQESPQPVVYLPFAQSEDMNAVFVVRSERAPREIATALEQRLGTIEPAVPIAIQSWSDTLAGELFPARAATVALGVIGLFAAMLAVTGIFGMAAYSVSRRKKELGIRVALGARKTQLLRAAIGRPIALLGAGSVLGLLAGILATRLLTHIVYQADPQDPLVLGGALLAMALLGTAASAIPARRALAIDPANLMRED